MFTTKKCIFYAIILQLLILFASVSLVNAAQISTSESTGISRTITQGDSLAPIDFYLFAKEGDTQLQLLPNALLESSATVGIEKKSITVTQNENDASKQFTLQKDSSVDITLSIDTRNAKPGIYTGKIIVISSNSTNLEIPIKIQINGSITYLAILNGLGVFLGFIFVVLGLPFQNIGKNQGFTARAKQVFDWAKIEKQAKPIIAFLILSAIIWLTAFVAYYPKIIAFGASPIDYPAAILFGLSQVGGAKLTADMFKEKK